MTQVTPSPFHLLSFMWNHSSSCERAVSIFALPALITLPLVRVCLCLVQNTSGSVPHTLPFLFPVGCSPRPRTERGAFPPPFSFRIRDCVPVCPPFSFEKRKGNDKSTRLKQIGFPTVHCWPHTHTHTHKHTRTCARLLLRPRVSSIRHGHESHHACHVHAHEGLGTSSRHQEWKGAKCLDEDVNIWDTKATTRDADRCKCTCVLEMGAWDVENRHVERHVPWCRVGSMETQCERSTTGEGACCVRHTARKKG